MARPALAKQFIGVVPQTNTLDRAMTVFENLEFHGRYFGMSAKNAKALRPNCCSACASSSGRRRR